MSRRVRRLNVTPLAVPVQLVLGLEGVGIRAPRSKRRRSTWLRPLPGAKAA